MSFLLIFGCSNVCLELSDVGSHPTLHACQVPSDHSSKGACSQENITLTIKMSQLACQTVKGRLQSQNLFSLRMLVHPSDASKSEPESAPSQAT